MKEFKGRIVASGTVTAKALVSHGGLNTLASFQKALQFGDKKATCGDQNNPDLYGKQMAGKALCRRFCPCRIFLSRRFKCAEGSDEL